jgi:TonB-dependent receptor
VFIQGTGQGVSTAPDGRYRLSGVSPGEQTLVVSFVGYEPVEQTISVSAGEITRIDIALESRVLESGEVIVTGLREGQLRSINQKRQALNVQDVLSADAIGKLPDQNVAEAVRRVPGVTIQLDNGEGRFVSIRGSEPSLNNVTVNGQSLASSAESRATALDLVPASMVSSIEVVKAITPDMDGNAVGGTVNINTLTAFDRNGPFAFGLISGLLHQQTIDYRDEQTPFRASFTAGTQFGADNQFGLVVSGDFSRRDFKASTVGATEFIEDEDATDNAFIRPEALETEVEDTRRDRYAVNANVDWRPTERTNLFARTFYSRTDEFDDNAEFQFEFAEVDQTSATAGTILEAEGALDLELTNEDESLLGLTLGGEHRVGAVTVNLDGSYTRGIFDRVTDKPEFVAEFAGSNLGSYSSGGDFLAVDYADFGAVSNPTNYIYDEIDLEFESNTEDTYIAEADVRWDTQLSGYQAFLKVGGTFRTRQKIIDDLEEGFNGGVNPFTLALDPVSPPTGLQGRARYPVMGDTEDLFDQFEAEETAARNGNSERFEADDAETLAEGIENDSNNDEDVYAGYVMGSVDLGRLTAVGGVRIEATETRSERFVAVFDDGEVTEDEVSSEVFTNNYVNVLPSLHLTFDVTNSLLVRAALSNTIGRPDYEELSGFREIEIEATASEVEASVNEGNPNLDPFKSLNLDVTAEYYTTTGGLFALGGFYKRVRDPIFEFETTETNTTLETAEGVFEVDELNFTQDRNADAGTILGLEATAQQTFVFLPNPFDGFGLASNLTIIDSQVDIPGRDDSEVPFFGQSDLIVNVIPYYQKAGVELRAAFSYQSEFLTSVGGAAFEDEYFDHRFTIDLTGSYSFYRDALQVQAQVRNLTNEAEQFYQGIESRRLGNIETGRTFSLGLSASF